MSELNPKPMEALEILPIDCWQSVFSHLHDDGLEAVSFVCKDFLAISNVSEETLQVVRPGVGKLSEHLKKFKNLKKISFRLFRGDLKEAILEIAQSEVSLDVLDFSGQCYFVVENLKELDSNSKMKNLKALNCEGVEILKDNDLVVIANSFPNLEQLKFGSNFGGKFGQKSHPKFLTGSGFEFLASKLKFLKKIHMFGSHCFSDRSLLALSLNCSFLKAVKVSGNNDGVTENGVGILLRNSPNLEALAIGYIRMDSSQSAITLENSIGHAKALNSLKFCYMCVSNMLLNAIAKAKLPLKKFRLKFCGKYTVAGLLMVLSCNHLNKLSISHGPDLEDEDMELLLKGDVGNITHLDIGYSKVKNSTLFLLSTKCPSLISMRCGKVFNGDNNIPLSRNLNVQNLYLTYSGIDDESVQQIALVFPHLRVLELSDCHGLTSTSVEAILKRCKFIRKLILKGYPEAKLVKDDSEFPEVINLEDLDLSLSFIKDEGLSAIADKCPRLSSLNLRNCKHVTTEGIKHIVRKITTLKCLNINYYDVRESKFRDLLVWMVSTANFASLKKIYHHRLYFTKEDEQKFLHRGCLLLKESVRTIYV